MLSGITRIRRYFLTAATNARPIPVFPEVGSIITVLGFKSPSFSAASIIERAIRSLMLPPGFCFSSFTHTSAWLSTSRLIFTVGVFPINSSTLFAFILYVVFQAEDGIRDKLVTGVQTCALPISLGPLAELLTDSEVDDAATITGPLQT